jgi:hypothetical protein
MAPTTPFLGRHFSFFAGGFYFLGKHEGAKKSVG